MSKVINRNKSFDIEKYLKFCFFCLNGQDRRGSVRCFINKIELINHMANCPCKNQLSPNIRIEVFQLIKKIITVGSTDLMVFRLADIKAKLK